MAVLRKHLVEAASSARDPSGGDTALGTPASGTPGSGWRVSRAPSAGLSAASTTASQSLSGVGRFKSRVPTQFFSRWRPGERGSPAARRQSIFLSTVEALESSHFRASPSLAPMYQFSFPFVRDAFRIRKPVWAPLPPPHCNTGKDTPMATSVLPESIWPPLTHTFSLVLNNFPAHSLKSTSNAHSEVFPSCGVQRGL